MEPISVDEIRKSQDAWSAGVIALGQFTDRRACVREAELVLDRLYAFGITEVLFKPTKAADKPFRLTRQGALSYFIGGDPGFPEDSGFAMQPWSSIEFRNAGIRIDGTRAAAMGRYTFTDREGYALEADYTLGYLKDDCGDLKIWLHHSSLPYQR